MLCKKCEIKNRCRKFRNRICDIIHCDAFIKRDKPKRQKRIDYYDSPVYYHVKE